MNMEMHLFYVCLRGIRRHRDAITICINHLRDLLQIEPERPLDMIYYNQDCKRWLYRAPGGKRTIFSEGVWLLGILCTIMRLDPQPFNNACRGRGIPAHVIMEIVQREVGVLANQAMEEEPEVEIAPIAAQPQIVDHGEENDAVLEAPVFAPAPGNVENEENDDPTVHDDQAENETNLAQDGQAENQGNAENAEDDQAENQENAENVEEQPDVEAQEEPDEEPENEEASEISESNEVWNAGVETEVLEDHISVSETRVGDDAVESSSEQEPDENHPEEEQEEENTHAERTSSLGRRFLRYIFNM